MKGAKKRQGEGMQKAALVVFAALFLLIFVQVVFFNSAFGYQPLLQGALLVLWLGFLLVLCGLGLRYKAWLYARRHLILAAAMALIFLVQLWVGIVTKQDVDHDYGKVYNGARFYVMYGDGEAFFPYKNYLHHFTNNLGAFLLLQLLFKGMMAVGLTCFYEVCMVVGHLIFAAAILCTFLYLDRAFGHGAALFSLVLWLGFLPVYLQSSILYTDTLSIWVPPLVLLLWQHSKGAAGWPKRVLCYAGMGFALGLGAQLKGTVVITGLALVAEALASRQWKRLGAAALALALGLAAVGWGFDTWGRALIIDEEQREADGMPVSFWVMMGLIGDGAYNPTDEWVITTSVQGQAARNAVNLEKIKERLAEMGPAGYLQLLHRKTCRSFGSGNGEVYYLLVRSPLNPGHWIYRFISTEGAAFSYFDNLCQGVYLSFYLFGILGVGLALKRRAAAFLQNTAPFIALAGFYLFMLLWESNHRQLVNQWPLYIMVAAAGAAMVMPAALRRLQGWSTRRKAVPNKEEQKEKA